MPEFFTLQELLLPGLEFPCSDKLYVRIKTAASARRQYRSLTLFPARGRVSFDSFFNALSVGTLKRATIIEDVFLLLEGRGDFILRVGIHRNGQAHRWVQEYGISLPSPPLALPWAELEDGLLHIELESLGGGEISGGRYLTRTAPPAPVRLGIVITHFNRQSYVVPAIARIGAALANRPDLAGKIELVVVDNSRNLTRQEAGAATVLPNPNYGGSGGFARGLIYLKDHGFTHCLFMDDDASCEIDSIFRAHSLLAYARDPALAISGALLRELEPYRSFEKGAAYANGRTRPLNHNRDMRETQQLLEAETRRERADYGAWWFFGFRIDQAKAFPFPFFVRGDDILFSLINRFCVETINGVACWGEDFQLKENPGTRYQGLRAMLTIALQTGSPGRLQMFRIMLGWVLSSLFSYNYASAEAIILAIRDVGKGPAFWRENLDNSAPRAELAPLNAREKLEKIDLADFRLAYRGDTEPGARRWLRLLSLNGMLLPGFLLRDQTVFEHKSFRASYRRIFRFRHVLYYYEAMGLGYVAHYDRRLFFRALYGFMKISARFLVTLPRLREAYQRALPEMTSEAFWRRLYAETAQPRKMDCE